MFIFQATIHARAIDVSRGVKLSLRGIELCTLIVPPQALAESFSLSFEEAAEALESLERMFIEPDGSFVWVSPHAVTRTSDSVWQLDGCLHDRNSRLLMVDLKGSCPEAAFDRLLGALGWPATPVMFQLSREAVFLDEFEFRRYAQSRRSPEQPT